LRDLIEAVPYRIHAVLTDDSPPRTRSVGIQFISRKQGIYDGWHIFDRVCEEHGIEHRLTKMNHPPRPAAAGRRPGLGPARRHDQRIRVDHADACKARRVASMTWVTSASLMRL
jgi:hypothetical protein